MKIISGYIGIIKVLVDCPVCGKKDQVRFLFKHSEFEEDILNREPLCQECYNWNRERQRRYQAKKNIHFFLEVCQELGAKQ